jgi:hypothetical protein
MRLHPDRSIDRHTNLLPQGEGTGERVNTIGGPVSVIEEVSDSLFFLSQFSPLGREGRVAPSEGKERAWERAEVRAVGDSLLILRHQ